MFYRDAGVAELADAQVLKSNGWIDKCWQMFLQKITGIKISYLANVLASLQNIPPKFEVFVAVYSGLGVHIFAGVAELADAKDLKSFGE